jgi:hypothetical protein
LAAVRRLIDGLIAQLRILAAFRRLIDGLIAQLRILSAVRRLIDGLIAQRRISAKHPVTACQPQSRGSGRAIPYR